VFLRKRKSITNEALIALAKRECEKEGWTWLEPVDVSEGVFNWTVITNSDSMGCNARVVISKRTGEVVKKSFTPR
jgi:hypothetical protein